MAKHRKKHKNSHLPAAPLKVCYIDKLPLELLAEIALYTKSPRDVLALTRSSKFFCRTFLHQSNHYIWRYVRQNCLPEPLPEPCSRFTESSFAAFVYDTGVCENCGAPVNFHRSFGLRLRLCLNDRCRRALQSTSQSAFLQSSSSNEGYKIFENTLPSIESPECLSPTGVGTWPDVSPKFRSSDWMQALQEYLDASSKPHAFVKYTNDCTRRCIRNKDFMQMCVALHSWKKKYLLVLDNTKETNMEFSKELANQEGLVFLDLMNTPTYGLFFKRKTQSLEQIKRSDYNSLEASIAADLVQIEERRDRRARENNYSAARRAVEKHYNRLRALKKETPLPCLPSFRELPIISQLQRSQQPEKEIDKSLQSLPIANLVHSELAKFHVDARNALGEILGFRDWKSPSNKKVHPAERLTARFQCRCQRVEAKYKDFGCLDYSGAIMHMCATTMDKDVSPKPFKASRFTKDVQAIAALSTLLELCSIPGDEKGSDVLLSAIGPRVLCLSCDAQIVLEPMAVIGHSHRHDSMSLALLPPDEASKILGNHPLSRGLVSKLTSQGKVATNNRNVKIYMCRHCIQKRPKLVTTTLDSASSSSSAATTSTVSDPPATDTTLSGTNGFNLVSDGATTDTAQAGVTSTPKSILTTNLYSFDGLRSHLQEVHRIRLIRDEDVICTKELQMPMK
ncbi:hypothetical protein GYMLUDRAFT_35899 [Collybiopsis luxurians FD-317 M1]|nr:hypothetical protein GYMLUDRAFT_35899 [Collybiopsis luxurians FD-317 M1]